MKNWLWKFNIIPPQISNRRPKGRIVDRDEGMEACGLIMAASDSLVTLDGDVCDLHAGGGRKLARIVGTKLALRMEGQLLNLSAGHHVTRTAFQEIASTCRQRRAIMALFTL